jgi:putative tryptophan/tyrosine transport system substrate-binding protein
MDFRWAGGDINRIRALAQELVGLQPDIIVTMGTAAAVALQQETRTIPIVFASVSDPVVSGIVAAINQPGGNITGFALFETTLGASGSSCSWRSRLGSSATAIMFNPDTAPVSVYMPSFETAARSLKVVPIAAPVHDDVEIETAIIALGRETGGALVVRIHSRSCIACRSYQRPPETTYRRSIRDLTMPEMAVCSLTELIR